MTTPNRIRLRIFASFGVALIVIVTGWVAAGALTSGMAAREEARERRKISDAAEDVYVHMLGAESAQRGYLLTMNRAYLEPYERAMAQADPALRLYEVVRKYDSMRPLAEQVVRSLAAKRAELAETILIADTQGVDPAIRVLNAGRGEALGNEIRASLERISHQVEQNRDAFSDHISRQLGLARAVVLSGTLLAFALAVAVNLGLMRAVRDREASQAVVEQQAEKLQQQTAILLRHEQQLGDQLQRQQDLGRQLQRSNDELDQFAYATSHDLKAPLRGIINLATFIEEDLGERATGDVRQNLGLLRSRARRLEALIEGILAYSRAGRVRSTVEEVNTAQLVKEVVELIVPPPGCDVSVVTSLPTLTTERIPLQQVLMNLIHNAIKHGCANKPGRIEVSAREDAGTWRFAVRDFGPGVAREFHDRIFAVFQTLAPRDQVEGTGIGLAVVKKLVESRGGTVQVRSGEGGGACFEFTWPTTAPTKDA